MIDLDNYINALDLDEDQEEKFSEEYQEKLFLEYVHENINKNDKYYDYKTKLYEAFKKGKPLTGQKGLRKQLGAIDQEYFGRAYLPHYFTRKSPEFHRELDLMWQDGVLKGINPYKDFKNVNKKKGCKKGIAAPRGHAKSTTFTFKDSIHAIVYRYKHYIMILSDSSDQAEGFLGDIKCEFEENRLIIEDFGDLKGSKWTDSVFITKTGIKVEGIGSGKKVRGRKNRNWRPDLIILDDVENDENVNTPEQRKKLANWFYKAVSKAGDTYTDIVYIGTMLHYDSLLAKVLKNPSYKCVKYKGIISFAKNQDLWDAWEQIYIDLENDQREEDAKAFFESNKQDMLEGTSVLWEDKLSYYDLMIIKVSEGTASFNSEIQNDPVDPDSCLFNSEWLDYYNETEIDFRDKKFICVGAIDPSLGKNKKSDFSTIITLMKDITVGYMYVYECSIERRHPDVIITDTIETQKRLRRDLNKRFLKLGCETNQFQQFFKDVLAKESAKCGEYLAMEEMFNTSDKKMRIERLQPFIKNKYIKFNPKHKKLVEYIVTYPMAANDDPPDCLEMAVRLAEKIGIGNQGDYRSILKRRAKFRKGAY
ncbi:phage terminase large subunit [Vallitalea guaymasensis]|uniref:phage terminase large subunit n=1 Tax=Vallitalea guaymasensis TaxID=1185412 RepID=UPI000DE24316|nr:phage terminase large subunit [Vallitalea guaymasensis]